MHVYTEFESISNNIFKYQGSDKNPSFTLIEHYNQEQAFISDQDYLREAMLVVLNFQLLPSVVKMDNKGKFCRFSKSGGCSKSIDFTDFSLSQIFKCYFEPV